MIACILRDQDQARRLIRSAAVLIETAQFQGATGRLAEAAVLWPEADGLRGTQQALVRSEAKYAAQIAAAKHAQSSRQFAKALVAARSARAVCPRSSEVMGLFDSIQKEKARCLLGEARRLAEAAEFAGAKSLLTEAARLWPGVDGLKEARVVLASKESEHKGASERCQRQRADRRADLSTAR